MRLTRHSVSVALTVATVLVGTALAQNKQNGEIVPAVSGTGSAGHIAVWKNSSTLASSVLSQSGGNVGIGTTTPAATLEVNGNAQVDGNFSFSGSISLTGVGPLIWANDASLNFSAGLGALPATTTGTNDTVVGDGALQYNTTGPNNTAIGNAALRYNTTGGSNTATGVAALLSNTTACCNVANGNSALYSNTTGTGNVAVGTSAMLDSVTGSWNTVEGNASMYNTTSGSYNTAIGNGALFNNSTGSNNIAIGSFGGNNITGNNNIDIGNGGTSTDSGAIRIGTPFVGGCTTCQTSAFIAGIYGTKTGLAGVPVVVDSTGNLGTISSSRRYKEGIQDMADASSGLLRLRPVTFRYKKPFEDGSKPVQYGLIAEEVAEVYPDLVARSADGQVETVKYQLLDSMLLNELQKQNATITAQKEQIRALEERLAKVEAALEGASVSSSR